VNEQDPQYQQHPQNLQATPEKKKTKKWPWIVGAVTALCIFYGANGGGEEAPAAAEQTTEKVAETKTDKKATDKATDKATEEVEEAEEAEPTAVAVKAGQIVKEFEDNELAADAKYKGRTLEITGVVDSIDTDIWDDEKYILALGSGGNWEFLFTNCHDMSTDELSTINKGDTVTVVGEFDDGGDLGVEVKNCALA